MKHRGANDVIVASSAPLSSIRPPGEGGRDSHGRDNTSACRCLLSPLLHYIQPRQQTWRVSRCLRREQPTALGPGQPVFSVRAELSVGDVSLCHRILTIFGDYYDYGVTEEVRGDEKKGGWTP